MVNIINNFQLGKIYTFFISDIIQIIIIFFALYYIVKSIRNTRAWILAKGIGLVYIVYSIVVLLRLTTVEYMMQQLFSLITVAIIIMFQPELQKLFESLGKQDFKTWYNKIKKDKNKDFQLLHDETIDEIVEGCKKMAAVKTGVLIVIERDIPLENVINSGIDINADITGALLINIFEKNTPLHDGAVVIKNNKVRAATCYLPLSKNPEIQKSLGTRHRAGIGISETTDALVIIVSEETGEISFCENGRINHGISPEILRKKLQAIGNKPTVEQEQSKHSMISANKISTKVVIVVVSIMLWASITNSQDAVVTTVIKNVPVSITNTNVLDKIGQTYNVTSGGTVNVKITGRRSVVSSITKSDLIAEADFRKLSQVYSVPIQVSSKKHNNELEINTTNNDVMILKLENIVEKELTLEVVVKGKPKSGSYLVHDDLGTDKIKVSAPETKVKSMKSAKLIINVDGKSNDFITFATPIIENSDGKAVNMSGVNLSDKSVRVSMKAYKTKEVNLVLNTYSSSDNEMYKLLEYKFEKNSINIAGDEKVLKDLKNIRVDLDLSTSDDSATSIIIDTQQYLPEGTMLVNNDDKQIELKIKADKYIKKSIQLSKSSIVINGLNSNRELKLNKIPEYIDCYILSTIDSSSININMMKPTLNIKDNTVGNHESTIDLTSIDGVIIDNKLSVGYSITKK
jgi:TIGR00159 family protein